MITASSSHSYYHSLEVLVELCIPGNGVRDGTGQQQAAVLQCLHRSALMKSGGRNRSSGCLCSYSHWCQAEMKAPFSSDVINLQALPSECCCTATYLKKRGDHPKLAHVSPAFPFFTMPIVWAWLSPQHPSETLRSRNKLIKYAISSQAVSPTGKERLGSICSDARQPGCSLLSQIRERGFSAPSQCNNNWI